MHSLGRLLLIREHASHRVKCTAHCMEIVHIELRCMAERPSNRLWNILTNIIWSPSSSASARWAAIKHILSELRVREYNASSTARSTRHIKRNQTRSMVLNRASIHPWSIVSCSVCSLHCPSRHHRLNPEYLYLLNQLSMHCNWTANTNASHRQTSLLWSDAHRRLL